MKKLIAIVLTSLVVVASISATSFNYDTDTKYLEIETVDELRTEPETEFTWAMYEMWCYKFGVEPDYNMYEKLCDNPQCYGDMDGSEIESLLKGEVK